MAVVARLPFAVAAVLRVMQFVRILNDMNMKRMSSVITIPMKYGVEFCELVMMMFSISKQTTTRNAMMARGLSAHDMMWEEREKRREKLC